MKTNPVTKAIKVVGLQRLASALGVSYQAIRKFEKGRTPAERVLAIETATGGKVSRHSLRPDIYPDAV